MVILGATLAVIFTAMIDRENKMCMGVEVVSFDCYPNEKTEDDIDVGEYILFQGEKAAYDKRSNIIYIPNEIDKTTTIKDMKGILEIALKEYQLKFIYCPQFDNLYQAVKENHHFQLVATDGQSYKKFDIVFTTLPVVSLYQEEIIGKTGDRDIYSGTVTMWAPNDKSTGTLSTYSGNIDYHYRGNSSFYGYKKSFKLAFREDDGSNRNIEFLGMGKDDDWILNGMVFDAVKINEKLCMDLWNEYVKDASYNIKMSTAEYVEVLQDGKYRGVYLLQRRLDPKYLNLSDKDILFRKTNLSDDIVEQDYEIKYSPYSSEKTYEIIKNIFVEKDYSVIDRDNLADVNVFMEFGGMYDNMVKNMYYVLKDVGNGYVMYFLPWDTDMVFGVVGAPSGFKYDKTNALMGTAYRPETVLYYNTDSDIYNTMADKWKTMRGTVFTDENIHNKINEYVTLLNDSGVYIREQEKWEMNLYNGLQTIESVSDYIDKKLEMMDYKYIE